MNESNGSFVNKGDCVAMVVTDLVLDVAASRKGSRCIIIGQLQAHGDRDAERKGELDGGPDRKGDMYHVINR